VYNLESKKGQGMKWGE